MPLGNRGDFLRKMPGKLLVESSDEFSKICSWPEFWCNKKDFDDPDFTTASFIYATLKCLDIVESYTKHQFHAHPHESSVITHHLAVSFVKPDESQEAKQSSLDAKLKASICEKLPMLLYAVDASSVPQHPYTRPLYYVNNGLLGFLPSQSYINSLSTYIYILTSIAGMAVAIFYPLP
jgi:hypothetical protein